MSDLAAPMARLMVARRVERLLPGAPRVTSAPDSWLPAPATLRAMGTMATSGLPAGMPRPSRKAE
ncbi:hypothetical protein D3C76_1716710 [compost metagenome]